MLPLHTGRLICALLMVSCGPKEIHQLDCCENGNWDGSPNHNALLFQVESGNLPPLADSIELAQFLTDEEIRSAFDSVYHVESPSGDTVRYRHWTYTPCGQLFDTLGINADLLLVEDKTCRDRDYRIQLRTFGPEHRMIDTLTYARWSTCPREFISGALYSDNTVTRRWHDGEKEEHFRITPDGRFVEISR